MISIAIDGPSGSGKGALAEGLSKLLNLIHLDTGAIFRGIACKVLEAGFTDPTESDIQEIIQEIDIEVVFKNGLQCIILNGNDVTSNLRVEAVSKMSSKISIFPLVREKYLDIVRNFASQYNCIIDGRDITSGVLPYADFKIYLTANEDIRAKRRYKENLEKNIACDYDEVLKNLKERDYRDTHRDIAPLKIVPDATVIDNSNISIEETVNICYKLIKEKLESEGKVIDN